MKSWTRRMNDATKALQVAHKKMCQCGQYETSRLLVSVLEFNDWERRHQIEQAKHLKELLIKPKRRSRK